MFDDDGDRDPKSNLAEDLRRPIGSWPAPRTGRTAGNPVFAGSDPRNPDLVKTARYVKRCPEPKSAFPFIAAAGSAGFQ